MKKTLAFILACIFCIGALCSCGGADVKEIIGEYKIESTLYHATLVDTAFNPTDKYTVREEDGKVKLFHEYIGVSGEEPSVELGELKKFSLKKSNFDKLIFGEAWDEEYSAEGIRNDNNGAFRAESESGESIYILLQKDGTVLLASMKTKEGVTSCAYIRKLAAK